MTSYPQMVNFLQVLPHGLTPAGSSLVRRLVGVEGFQLCRILLTDYMAPTFVLKFIRALSGAPNLASEFEGPLVTICGEWRDNITCGGGG